MAATAIEFLNFEVVLSCLFSPSEASIRMLIKNSEKMEKIIKESNESGSEEGLTKGRDGGDGRDGRETNEAKDLQNETSLVKHNSFLMREEIQSFQVREYSWKSLLSSDSEKTNGVLLNRPGMIRALWLLADKSPPLLERLIKRLDEKKIFDPVQLVPTLINDTSFQDLANNLKDKISFREIDIRSCAHLSSNALSSIPSLSKDLDGEFHQLVPPFF